MKRKLLIAAIAATLFSAGAWAQWGPGMMGGYGPGYGGGPGAMGGNAEGYGPGMMGGYGPGNGMGTGMMGGYGPGNGMGPGMMGGYGPGGYDALDLSDEQRDKIATIQREVWKQHWALMGSMHELRGNFFGGKGESDADAQKNYDAMAALQKQMFQSSLDARKRIDAVLTKEQREQLAKGSRRGWGHR